MAGGNSPSDLVLSDRDSKILSLVHEYRFPTAELIWRLMREKEQGSQDYAVGKDGKKRPSKYGFGRQALYKRLQLLSRAGFLVPHRLTDRPYGGPAGSPQQVYQLRPPAIAPVAEMLGSSPEKVRRMIEANNKVKVPFMRHALEIATFKAALVLATGQSGGKVTLTYWEQGSQLRDFAVGRNEEGDDLRYSVYPDAFFGLWVEGAGHANFFLELDRGTMPIVASHGKPDIRKKVLGYKSYGRKIKDSCRYLCRLNADRKPIGLVVNQSGREFGNDPSLAPIRGFRALFLLPGSIDQDGSPQGRLANVLSAIPTFGRELATSHLCWFAPQDAFDLENPLSVFGRYWLTPNPAMRSQSLVE